MEAESRSRDQVRGCRHSPEEKERDGESGNCQLGVSFGGRVNRLAGGLGVAARERKEAGTTPLSAGEAVIEVSFSEMGNIRKEADEG